MPVRTVHGELATDRFLPGTGADRDVSIHRDRRKAQSAGQKTKKQKIKKAPCCRLVQLTVSICFFAAIFTILDFKHNI